MPAALRGRKLVRTARIDLLVVSYDEARAAVDATVEGAGGFVSDAELHVRDRGREGELTVRVPADALDDVLAALRELGKVRHESVATEDVTRQVVDTDARLRNLTRTEKRLLELLDTAAGELAHVLEVERELNRVRGEIEATTAQLAHLDERVSLATVHVSLREVSEEIVDEPDDVWLPVRQLRRSAGAMVLQSLGVVLHVAVAIAIVALYVSPWIALIALAVVLKPSWRRRVAAWWRRRRDRGGPAA